MILFSAKACQKLKMIQVWKQPYIDYVDHVDGKKLAVLPDAIHKEVIVYVADTTNPIFTDPTFTGPKGPTKGGDTKKTIKDDSKKDDVKHDIDIRCPPLHGDVPKKSDPPKKGDSPKKDDVPKKGVPPKKALDNGWGGYEEKVQIVAKM